MKSENGYNFLTLHFKFVNVCVIIITILAVNSFQDNCELDEKTLDPPFYFSYRLNTRKFKNLKLRVTFTNMTPGVVYELYETVSFDTGRKPKKKETEMIKQFHYNKKKACISITKTHEVKNHLTSIFLEMVSNASWCHNITIFEGIALYTNTEVAPLGYKTYSSECSQSEFCTILINLKRECTDTRNITTTEEPTTVPDNKYSHYNSTTLTNNNISTSPRTNVDTTTIKITASNTSEEGAHQQPTTDSNVLTYVIPSVIVVCVIILVIYISVKKYCPQHSQPVETLELNTYATTTDLVYADLNLVHGDGLPPRSDEGSTYAEIIGVMKPVDTMKNK